MKRASKSGYLIKINEKRYILTSFINEIGLIVQEILKKEKNQEITIKNFAKSTGITRNLSVEILEYFDKIGFTKRINNGRVLKKPFEDLKLLTSNF